MRNKKIRQALNEIIKLKDEMSEGMYMDNAMDGSGECGGIIARSWGNWFDMKLNTVLDKYQVTLSELRTIIHEWANKELELGPKQRWVSMYSKTDGMYMPVDYLDTKWGSLAFELDYMYCEMDGTSTK